ncbi:Methane oxygenase PmoA [Tangfeifania diversioriginum]|uniref:Methane oxygenase PmoA n=1 Tax=Tangfeifania diversioriginum TaxID=1168035 RepID=A0A1M6DP51_9BACT|nr:PmoA family protein [Tangfeifania diversioriginum]SHI75007.1 Methane oxygenase PmoA [Tangfeifania diversioriginum]
MNFRNRLITIAMIFTTILFCQCGNNQQIELKVSESDKKVDVLFDGQLFTSYIYPDNIMKPVLWPVVSPAGNILTRSYPMENKAGDRTDHPHHVGVWLNYGDVNGLDFWNNSEAIPEERKSDYGRIYHTSVEKAESGKNKAELVVENEWKAPDGTKMLDEETNFTFSQKDENIRIIDRTTTLEAVIDEVKFTDNKEGMFAIRVARELELPSDSPTKLMDSHGNITEVKEMDNSKVKGDYRSSEGIEGAEVWGTRARWMKLSSEINGEKVALVIIDHPSNVGYPTYWHARGYGLFAANTLGQKIFSDGENELNFSLTEGETTTFKYRFVVASGELSDEKINELADEYASM